MLTFLRKIRKSLIESGSTRKYFLYAIGEITLVVIGILIALQINNWNESRKNHERIRENVKGLMVDLRNDSIHLSTNLLRIEREYQIFESFKARLTNPESTLDTLIQIARHEFSPVVNLGRLENNSTYDILVMSGEVNLFDRKIIEEMNNYYSFYEKTKISDYENWNLYLNSAQEYTRHFTHKFTFINEGHLLDEIWESAEIATLLPKFTSWADSKRLYYSQRERKLKILEEMNDSLSSLLKESFNTND